MLIWLSPWRHWSGLPRHAPHIQITLTGGRGIPKTQRSHLQPCHYITIVIESHLNFVSFKYFIAAVQALKGGVIKGRFKLIALCLLLALSSPTNATAIESTQTKSGSFETDYQTQDPKTEPLIDVADHNGRVSLDGVAPSALVDKATTERLLNCGCSEDHDCNLIVRFNTTNTTELQAALCDAVSVLNTERPDTASLGTINKKQKVGARRLLSLPLRRVSMPLPTSSTPKRSLQYYPSPTYSPTNSPTLQLTEGYIIFTTKDSSRTCDNITSSLQNITGVVSVKRDSSATTTMADMPSLRGRSAEDHVNSITEVLAMEHDVSKDHRFFCHCRSYPNDHGGI